jgi:hypothetical protein
MNSISSELRAMESLHGQLSEEYGESWAEEQIVILVCLKEREIRMAMGVTKH